MKQMSKQLPVRWVEAPPVELGVRLKVIHLDDLSPWIAAFRAVIPQYNEDLYRRLLQDAQSLDAAARTLQSFCQPLLQTLANPGLWYCGKPRTEESLPPAIVKGWNGAKLTAWDLAFLELLRSTGPEGQIWCKRLLPEAIQHASCLEQVQRSVDPWSFWYHTETEPSGPITLKAAPILVSARRIGIEINEEDIIDPYELINMYEAFTSRAWRAIAWAIWCDRLRRPVYMTSLANSQVIKIAMTHDVSTCNGKTSLTDKNGNFIASIDVDRMPITADRKTIEQSLLITGKNELSRLATPRFLLHFAQKVQKRPIGEWDTPVEWKTWGELSEALYGRDDETRKVKALIELLYGVIIHYPEAGDCSLFNGYSYAVGKEGHPGHVRLTPGAPWLGERDHFMRSMKDRSHRVRSLVPLIDIPEPIGHRDHAAQARFFLGGLLPALAESSSELAKGNGVYLPIQWWIKQAAAWEIPNPTFSNRLREAWTRGERAPLVNVSTDRYHLSERYMAERELLEQGGKVRIGASMGGKASIKSRRRKQD